MGGRAVKIHPDALAAIREGVAPLDTEYHRERYRAGDFPRADRVQDVNKRYRWDLFAAGAAGLIGMLYDAGLNDSHIDTALRAIVPPL